MICIPISEGDPYW